MHNFLTSSRWPLVLALVSILDGCGGGSSPNAPTPIDPSVGTFGWAFTPDPGIRLADGGVGPTPFVAGDGSVLLFYADRNVPPVNPVVARSSDGLSFARITGYVPGQGANYPRGNPTGFVRLSDGRIRTFFRAAANPPYLGSAISSSNDGLSWTVEPGVRYDLSGNIGHGRIARLSSGGCRYYYTFQDTGTHADDTAFAPDCFTFTKEGFTTPGGERDVASLSAGGALMVFDASVGPSGPIGLTSNSLYVAVSTDGLAWTSQDGSKPLFSDPSYGIVDVSLLALGGDRFRVYYAGAVSNAPGDVGPIKSGILTKGTAISTQFQPAFHPVTALPRIVPR